MLLSFALIFILAFIVSEIFHKIRLPHIVGMLAVGIILGPYVLNVIDISILNISAELRKIALIIILLKAGISLNINALKRVGRPAVLMSFVPASCEIISITLLAPVLLGITHIEGAIIGSVLAAVSPAVVVPKMVELTEKKYGTEQGIPQLIMAGASLDDVFVIVMFTTFVGIEQGESASIMSFISIPIAIVTGVLVGLLVGLLLSAVFKKFHMSNTKKVILILAFAFLVVALEDLVKNYIAYSGLLAAMSMALGVQLKSNKEVTKSISESFGDIWVCAECILFVLVGASVNITTLSNVGLMPVILILLGLVGRSIGVFLCMLRTKLIWKERLFCIIAYLPKATVQAAIGSVPLALGLACGNIVLLIAVLAIIITAPMGAIGMDLTYKKLLKREK